MACQALRILPAEICKHWIIRINHTRLADSILDLCGVPLKEQTRQAANLILTKFVTPRPSSLVSQIPTSKSKKVTEEAFSQEVLDSVLNDAILNHGMTNAAASSLRLFAMTVAPLPHEIRQAIEKLKTGISAVKHASSVADSRRAKRFEDAAKALRGLLDLVQILSEIEIKPSANSKNNEVGESLDTISRPLSLSIDLGLRQRRKHYNGGVLYQFIVLPYLNSVNNGDDFESLLVSGKAVKIAEGGNYSELVRKHRPPGSFAGASLSYYATAPIPACVGVRFAIGKMVGLLYLDASAVSGDAIHKDSSFSDLHKVTSEKQGLDVLRMSLGHPIHFAESVMCIVASAHGMDAASVKERFVVAAKLWAAGISTEFLPHSGVMLSLLRRLNEANDENGSGASDWSLTELFGACALLKIPYVVIVQPHLLKEKSMVRLRRISTIDPTATVQNTSGSNEMMVSLGDLANNILGDSLAADETDDPKDAPNGSSTSNSARDVNCDCIYVDQDQFFGSSAGREVLKSETLHWRTILKNMKSASLSAEAYLSSFVQTQSFFGIQWMPVFAVSCVDYWTLREFGTELMRREVEEQSSVGASNAIAERHPKHRRVMKTLSGAIDNYMRRHGIWGGASKPSNGHKDRLRSGESNMTMLFYSKPDDRFDLVTLVGCGKGHGKGRQRK